MNISFDHKGTELQKADLVFVGAYTKTSHDKKKTPTLQLHWPSKDLEKEFLNTKIGKTFNGDKGTTAQFSTQNGETVIVVGCGDKDHFSREGFRRTIAKMYKSFATHAYKTLYVDLDSFPQNSGHAEMLGVAIESLYLAHYSFDGHKSSKPKEKLNKIIIGTKEGKPALTEKIHKSKKAITDSINFARDLINEVPNILTAPKYADLLAADVKKHLPSVKVKIMNKAEIKKQNMNLLLAVNAGSHVEPRFIHLSYSPKGATTKTKHYALVGKGITFDTGGYSLKPGASMMGMKYDMGGSASVYAAFRASVLLGCPHKLSCILAVTDNKIGPDGTVPDSIIKSRNGKTVEILNTDAEGRLILADALDYTCELKPDAIIDAATLTGACIVSLGKQVAAVLGNSDQLINKLLESASEVDEYVWRLPIIQEYRDDIKSSVADLKNIGTAGQAGTPTSAAFLDEFIKDKIPHAHLDIAGVCDSQNHLPYCPPSGASGIIIRTIIQLLNGK